MATTTFTPTRALRRPRHIDLRAVLGIFILLLATVGAIVAWSGGSDSRAVLVVTHDLPPGTTLSASDLGIVHLRADASVSADMFPATDEDQLIGKAVAEPVHGHQVLLRVQLSPRPPLAPGQVAMSFPVTAESAVGGRLHPGDRIRIYATTAKGTPTSKTVVLVEQTTVLDVGYDQRTTIASSAGATDGSVRPGAPGTLRSLTVSLTPRQAEDLAAARWNGDLDVSLLAPASPQP